MAVLVPIELFQGEDKPITVTFTNNPDLTGSIFSLAIKEDISDAVAVVEKEHIDFNIDLISTGIIVFNMDEEDTDQTPGNYTGQLKVIVAPDHTDKSLYIPILILKSVVD